MSKTLIDFLTAPAPFSEVSWKAQNLNEKKTAIQMVAYLDGRYYEDRLDAAVAEGHLVSWSEGTEVIGVYGTEVTSICHLSLETIDSTLRRTGVGSGTVGSHASAVKTAATDAFKRACARAGLGRFLYGLPKVWVPAEGKYPQRDAVAKLASMTEAMLVDLAAGMDDQALTRKYTWTLTRDDAQQPRQQAPAGNQGQPPMDPALVAARKHLTAKEQEVRKAGKGGGIVAVFNDFPNRLNSVDEARAAYRALNALLPIAL